MKDFFVMTVVLLIICIIGYIKSSSTQMEWMDKKYTTIVKGLSILSVIWAHAGAELQVNGIQFIAGIGVSLFLICSGYGLEISYKKSGLKFYWIKRASKILLPMLLIEFIWQLVINQNFNLDDYILNTLAFRAGGWYIKYIIICYIIFYFTKLIITKVLKASEKVECIALLICFIAFFAYECICPYSVEIPFLRARQMFSFFSGIMLAKNKEKITTKLQSRKSTLIMAFVFIAIGIGFMFITQIPAIYNGNFFIINLLSLPTVYSFALAFLIITFEYISILKNKTLYYIGLISFELFLSQSYGLPYIYASIKSLALYLCRTTFMALALFTIVSGINKLIKFLINSLKREN